MLREPTAEGHHQLLAGGGDLPVPGRQEADGAGHEGIEPRVHPSMRELPPVSTMD